MGGSRTRSPKEYKPDAKLAETGVEYETNEYMHSSVRIRLKRLGNDKWGIKRAALKDFDLVEDVDAESDDRRSGWIWVKQVKGELIKIPEMRMRRLDEPFSSERQLLDNETLEMVNEGTKEGRKLVDVN